MNHWRTLPTCSSQVREGLPLLAQGLPLYCGGGVGSDVSLPTPVPGGSDGPSGVLVCCENYLVYKNFGDQPDLRCPIPRRKVGGASLAMATVLLTASSRPLHRMTWMTQREACCLSAAPHTRPRYPPLCRSNPLLLLLPPYLLTASTAPPLHSTCFSS